MKIPSGYITHRCEEHDDCVIVTPEVSPDSVPAETDTRSAIELLMEQTPTYHTSSGLHREILRVELLMEDGEFMAAEQEFLRLASGHLTHDELQDYVKRGQL